MPLRIPISWLRLWTSRDLPFARPLLSRAGVWRHEHWRNARSRTCRLRWSRCRVRLDLRDYHQRAAYFLGRLMDVPVQLFIREALRPGDLFVDVGANIGVLTLLGASAVGSTGRVVAIEPNPDVCRRLSDHVDSNRLRQVHTVAAAISEQPGEMTLSIPPTGNTGAATLGTLPARHGGRVHASYRVPVRTGDEVLSEAAQRTSAPMLIKVDVEGHEPSVLGGLDATIRTRRPAIILELNHEMLAGAGSSPATVIAFLRDRGYAPFTLGATWSRWRRCWTLTLAHAPPNWAPRRTLNAAFLVPGGAHEHRLRRFMRPKAS